MSIPLVPTIIVLLVCLAVLAAGQIRERRKYQPGRATLIPWVPLQYAAAIGALLMAANLIVLLTGHPFPPRGLH
jgi:hypothetical protein